MYINLNKTVDENLMALFIETNITPLTLDQVRFTNVLKRNNAGTNNTNITMQAINNMGYKGSATYIYTRLVPGSEVNGVPPTHFEGPSYGVGNAQDFLKNVIAPAWLLHPDAVAISGQMPTTPGEQVTLRMSVPVDSKLYRPLLVGGVWLITVKWTGTP